MARLWMAIGLLGKVDIGEGTSGARQRVENRDFEWGRDGLWWIGYSLIGSREASPRDSSIGKRPGLILALWQETPLAELN